MVDDDLESRAMLGLVLSGEGYEVSHTSNGKDAVSLHRQKPFDLVITEVALKEKDGFETLMELNRKSAPARLIATAKAGWISSELSLRMARQLGAHFLLAKPFQPEELLAVVHKALGER
jgi:DNA-binding response OmpR family regulator